VTTLGVRDRHFGNGRRAIDGVGSKRSEMPLVCGVLRFFGNWLGGRDSNPDNVVQRAVNGFRSVPVRSVLLAFSALLIHWPPLRSALFTHKMSHCVSGSEGNWSGHALSPARPAASHSC
jgi:hypothetical protein